MRFVRIAFSIMVVSMYAGTVHGQTPTSPTMPGMKMPPQGVNVMGMVTSASGGNVQGATVTATSTVSGAQWTAISDAQGHYMFPSLLADTYDIAVQARGFKPFTRPALNVAGPAVTLDARLEAAPEAAGAGIEPDRQQLMDRISELEKRISDLESSTVLSEPETRVKRIEVYVDQNGVQYDQPTAGARREVTYQRERVYRRQTINEKIEEAMAAAEDQSVRVGVDATTVTQGAGRTTGVGPNKKAYALASADLFFTAKLAQYTSFFADVVALSGAPPDREIHSLTLLNGYTARLVNQNELNLREAWLRTEIFGQRLALTAGRLDLTNYFDRNTASNDETTQFISDALVNNQMLGLSNNGTGIVADYDPKNPLSFRFGVQQSNPDATSLSDSIYSLAEVGYTMTPFSLPEGHYRLWYRANNGSNVDSKHAVGVSIDQKVSPVVTLFGRYGTQKLEGDVVNKRGLGDRYASGGVSFANGWVFNPRDSWGIGYAQMDLASGDTERLTEWYYNVRMTEKLRLSFSLQHVLDEPGSESKFGYLLPGIRLQAAF